MSNRLTTGGALAMVVGLALHASAGFGQDVIEGTVAGTKLTRCTFKPGGCEGTLILETQGEGKIARITINVPLGTPIKKGDEDVYLPTLNGKAVSIVHITERGEKIAKSIEVRTVKP